jgi:hypothetical protein
MVDKNNPLRNVRVEFHILQSFPVTCLNRDDVGAPKTAVVGGTTRARVSSQCWKRQVRLSLHEPGIPGGTRTKLIKPLIEAECIRQGAFPETGTVAGNQVLTSLFSSIFRIISDTEGEQILKNRAISETGNPNSRLAMNAIVFRAADRLLLFPLKKIRSTGNPYCAATLSAISPRLTPSL